MTAVRSRARAVVGVTVVALALAGCGGSGTASAPQPGSLLPPLPTTPSSAPATPTTAPTTTTVPTTAPTTPGGTPQSASPGLLPTCVAGDLSLSLGASNAGAGTAGYPLVFRNVGQRTCTMAGYPGVSFVTGDAGEQVGTAAVRSGPDAGVVTLDPGAVASALVLVSRARSFPAADCTPTEVRGFRVYAPDDTAAMFVEEPDTGCASRSVDVLRVQSVVPGDSGGV